MRIGGFLAGTYTGVGLILAVAYLRGWFDEKRDAQYDGFSWLTLAAATALVLVVLWPFALVALAVVQLAQDRTEAHR